MDKEKKVCFLTLVNQVNGLLGGRSRVPNGLIMEEVDDGNKQQEERHRLTHLHLPPLDSPGSISYPVEYSLISWSQILSKLKFC